MIAVILACLTLVQHNQITSDTSLVHKWSFEASCQDPSTSLDGTMRIVFDSATYVVGAIKLGTRTLPFHGRHLDRRLALRTDKGFNPVIRIDCAQDSLGSTLTGVLQSSKVHAVDARKHAKDFFNVMFQFYGVKE